MARLKTAEFDESLTLVEHLDELRTRLIVSRHRPRASRAVSASGRTTCCWTSPTSPLPDGYEPTTFSPTEPFFTTVKISIYAGILIALPILLYQAYAYVLPAFAPRERRVVLPLLLMVPLLFIAGVVFAYFVVVPPALQFLLNFNDEQFNIQIRAADYYGFFVLTLISIGILFQIPVGDPGGDPARDRHPRAARAQPPLCRARDRDRRDAAARDRPGDDADRDGPAATCCSSSRSLLDRAFGRPSVEEAAPRRTSAARVPDPPTAPE